MKRSKDIVAVDLFCGAGGLTCGLRNAGIDVRYGIDLDVAARHAYEANNDGSQFLQWDISKQDSDSVAALFEGSGVRLLAGCAPCQPFSKLTQAQAIERHKAWNLLDHFGRLVEDIRPEAVAMENVPDLARRGNDVFSRFLARLRDCDYHVDWDVVRCEEYGVPQMRRRLILLASKLGEISIPKGARSSGDSLTVRDVISDLPPLQAGEACLDDPLHCAAQLSEINLRRVRATPHDGGSRNSWPHELVLECHKKPSGATYQAIYGRMWWDRPAPTMTTLCTGIGNGRFGHPEQDRAISLREAALFQSFPRTYEFWPAGERLNKKAVGRMIGNAVPPKLAEELGKALVDNVFAEL